MVCPAWWDDSAEHTSPEFHASAQAATAGALHHAARALPTEAELRDWHRSIFRAVVPLDYYAGNYRQDDPSRPCLGLNVEVGGSPGFDFHDVTPAVVDLFEQVRLALTSLDLQWNVLQPQQRAQRLCSIVGTAVARFVHIHPFINGNGRISRIVWMTLLHRFGLPPQVSTVRHPGPPYDALMASAMRGDYAPTVLAVLDGLRKCPLPRQLALPTNR